MKIRVVSDLHLDFDRQGKNTVEYLEFLENELLPAHDDDKDTVLVLPGDIDLEKRVKLVYETWAPRFKAIVGVAGNHEFYGGSINRVNQKIDESVCHLPNAWFLDMQEVDVDDVWFVGATLWTDFDNLNQTVMFDAKLWMNDYKQIRVGPPAQPYQRKLTPVEVANIHLQHKAYMFERIKKHKSEGKTVVAVSHHLPTYLCIDEKYKGQSLNGCYASELWYDMEAAEPDLWVHGHVHNQVDIIPPGLKTRIVCNPRGYWPSDMNSDFDPNFSVEV